MKRYKVVACIAAENEVVMVEDVEGEWVKHEDVIEKVTDILEVLRNPDKGEDEDND